MSTVSERYGPTRRGGAPGAGGTWSRYRSYSGGPDPLADEDRSAAEGSTREEASTDRGPSVPSEGYAAVPPGRGAGGPAVPLWPGARSGREPTSAELRRLGEEALREIEAAAGPAPGSRPGVFGAGGEPTGASLPRDELDRPLDPVASVREAVLRRATGGVAEGRAALLSEDLRYAETGPERSASVFLLVDLSPSMVIRGLHEAAARTALALHALVRTRHPEDRVTVIGFGERAREMGPVDLVAHEGPRTPGTNLHHALRLARTGSRSRRGARRAVMVITDGEPTAHLDEEGRPRFSWPPSPRTAEVTGAELDATLAEGAEVTFFLMADDERPRAFRRSLSERPGVRVVDTTSETLGPAVIGRYPRGSF
ncbi:VWA domain-containing protein [Nocardiopsis alba]|uniref:VWA domain-containing protein n=1 Tax=Nocardiopsis alba TaxID=53437 RepID=UPI0037F54BE7